MFDIIPAPYQILIKTGIIIALCAGLFGYGYHSGYQRADEKQKAEYAKALQAEIERRDEQAAKDRALLDKAESERAEAIKKQDEALSALAKVARANPSLKALKIDKQTKDAVNAALKAGMKP